MMDIEQLFNKLSQEAQILASRYSNACVDYGKSDKSDEAIEQDVRDAAYNLYAYIITLEARRAPPVHVDAATPAPKLNIGDIVYWLGSLYYIASHDYVQSDTGNFWDYGLSLGTDGCPCIMVSEAKLLLEWKAANG